MPKYTEETKESEAFTVETTESKLPESSASSDNKLPGCKYHLGYLGENSIKDIPDDCLICTAIVQCMRKAKE